MDRWKRNFKKDSGPNALSDKKNSTQDSIFRVLNPQVDKP